jgi:nucleotide-binding universal stress UspA family protein
MIRTILVALDGSLRAPAVFAAAAELARRFQAELVLLRVIFIPAEFPPAGHMTYMDPLRAQMIRDAEVALGDLASTAPDVRVTPPLVRHGQPWKVILEVSDELYVDLIVMGSHGYHGLDRVLGTTAGKVANLASRNVLVVHTHVPPKRDRSPSSPDEDDDKQGHGHERN